MSVARVRKTIKGKTYESVLLRQSYRRGQQVKHRTLASLTALPSHVVDAIEGMLKGESWVPSGDALIIQRSWPHGHVAAILGTAWKLELESLLDPEPGDQRDLALAMIVARVLHPASKLATTRLWGSTSLAGTLEVEEATEDHLYGALDWLLERQERIEVSVAMCAPESPAANECLMEEVCERENLKGALKRVRAKRGSPGVDGMRVQELPVTTPESWNWWARVKRTRAQRWRRLSVMRPMGMAGRGRPLPMPVGF